MEAEVQQPVFEVVCPCMEKWMEMMHRELILGAVQQIRMHLHGRGTALHLVVALDDSETRFTRIGKVGEG
jgi:hypothetical protein